MNEYDKEPDLAVRVLSDDEAINALKGRWNELADNTVHRSVFLRHEWFDAAWQWLKADCSRFVLTVSRRNQVIGIVPLVSRIRSLRGIRVTSLEFMLVPDSQACDVICAPSDVKTVIRAVAAHLDQNHNGWDVIQLDRFPADSPALALLGSGTGNHEIEFRITGAGTNPQIDLSGTWRDYYSQRSRRLKKGNNHAANRLQKSFSDIRIDWIRAADISEPQLREVLDKIIDLSSRSWKTEVGRSLDNSGPNQFIRRLTSHAFDRDWLSVWILTLDERPAAMEYQIACYGNVHALRSDFDLDLSDLSPGTYLNWKMLERLFEQELECYQMGPGNNQYKLRWTDDLAPLMRVTAYSTSIRGRIVGFLECILIPAIKVTISRFRRSKSAQYI